MFKSNGQLLYAILHVTVISVSITSLTDQIAGTTLPIDQSAQVIAEEDSTERSTDTTLAIESSSDQRALSHLTTAEVPIVDSSSVFLRDFLMQAGNDGIVCKAESPLLSWGRWSCQAFPFPYYQEEYGWEAGPGFSLYRDSRLESPIELSAMISYGEREDRVYERGIVSLNSKVDFAYTLTTNLLAYNRLGVRGIALAAGLANSRDAQGDWYSFGILLAHDSYRGLDFLSPTDWNTGENTFGGLRFKYDDFGRIECPLGGLQLELKLSTSQNILGGDYSNRRLVWDANWAKPYGSVWVANGYLGGRVPVQDLFDLAIDGGIRSGSIRQYRTNSFWAAGIEGRFNPVLGIQALPYLTAARGNGIDEELIEFGVGFDDNFSSEGFSPDNWFVRVDFPIYSNAGIENSRRTKWDLRRVMVRINLPLESINRDEAIRYRFPNR